MSTTTKPKPSRAALARQRDSLNLERTAAERHLETLLAKAQAAEREQASFDADKVPAESIRPHSAYFPPGTKGGALRRGGVVRYHEPPSPEAIAAAQDAAQEAQHRYEEAERALAAAPADANPEAECRRTGARYYSGSLLILGGSTYLPNEPVSNSDLAGLPGRKLAALVRAGLLRDANPFAEVRP